MRKALARYRHRRLLERMAGPKLLRAFAAARPEAFFIEIGANDGEHHDHLRELILAGRWRGVMVEPVPYLFTRLEANYRGIDRVTLVNAAIADRDGTLPFFHVADASEEERAGLPDWYDGIGSFSREAVLSHERNLPDVAERLVEREVDALSFDTLTERVSAEVDLLVIDTEGHDWEILRTIDFARHRPRIVVYEHFHLGRAVHTEARAHLQSVGYAGLSEGFDTFNVRPGDGDALDLAWRRATPAVDGVYAEDE